MSLLLVTVFIYSFLLFAGEWGGDNQANHPFYCIKNLLRD